MLGYDATYGPSYRTAFCDLGAISGAGAPLLAWALRGFSLRVSRFPAFLACWHLPHDTNADGLLLSCSSYLGRSHLARLGLQPNKVYIGRLPEHTRKEDLESCFGKIGNIVNIELK